MRLHARARGDRLSPLLALEPAPVGRLRAAQLLRLWIGLLCLCAGLALAPSRAWAAFGLVHSGGVFSVDTGAGLVFKVRQSNGDISSLQYNGIEYQNPLKGSHINSGLGTATVSARMYGADAIKIEVVAGTLTHYYLARRGYSNITMATYFTQEPTIGLVRFIVRIPSAKLPNGPTSSDIRNNTGAIEAGDVFSLANGQTRSKHYSDHRLIDFQYTGATGPNVGVWMVRSNHEGGSGGPFYRTIDNQCGEDQEIYEIINYGEGQTEPFRLGVLNGPYVLAFTSGAPPSLPIDTSWIHASGMSADIAGWVQHRGTVQGQATGIPAGFEGVVGFANATAQYWCKVAEGAFASPWMIPGTYTMTLYKGELAVATDTVSVPQSTVPVARNIASAEAVPPIRWRIGEWDGTPAGFLNADKVTSMHPSDVRMNPWGAVTYTVGASSPAEFPCYQWKDVNNPTTIKFNLAPGQATPHTLRVGLTCAFSGARPRVSVNNWTSVIPAPSTQPDSRTLTVGTYRGNNVTYTYEIPASAFVVGTNIMTLTVVSGSGGTGFLSAGYSYDCVELGAPLSGAYRISPQHAPGKSLTVSGASPANGTPIVIASESGAAQQQFLLDVQSDGSYRIRTALAGNRCLELPLGDASEGTPVKLWDDNGNSAQRWLFTPVGDGLYKIVPKNDASKCMDVNGGPNAIEDGTPVQSYSYGGGANQKWKLSPIGEAASIQLSAANYFIAENSASATITVTRTGNIVNAASVAYTTANGTAQQPGDYGFSSGTLQFAPGESSKYLQIPIVDDLLDEEDETLTLALSSPQGGAILGAQSTATISIADNDAAPTLSIGDASISEGDAGSRSITFALSLSAPSSRVITLDYATSDGSATAPADYGASSGTLTFPAGLTSATISISIAGDGRDEADESFTLNLSNLQNASFADGDTQATATISDDDSAGIIVAPSSLETSESGLGASFSVQLSSQPSADVSIALSSSNVGEGTVAPAALLFTPENWSVAQSIAVSGVDDNVADGAQSYSIVTAPAQSVDLNYNGRDAADVSASNADNDAPSLALSIDPASVAEGAAASGRISRNTLGEATVLLSSSDSSQASVPAQVVIPAGQISATFVIQTTDDAIAQGTRSASITASGAGLSSTAIVNVLDNDGAGIVVSPPLGLSTSEAGQSATFSVRLSSQPSADVVIGLLSSDPSEGAPATSTCTFTPTNWSLPQLVTVRGVDDVIVDGARPYSIITVPAKSADTSYNGRDALDVALSNADDDVAILSLVLPSSAAPENTGKPLRGTVSRSSPASSALVVALSSSDTSEARVPATVTVAAGATSATFSVSLVDDLVADGSQAVTVSAQASGFAASATARLLVTDNEIPSLLLSVKPERLAENGAAVATLKRNTEISRSTGALVVSLSLSTLGRATVPRTVTIPPRASSVSFAVRGLDNRLAEGPRIVSLSARANGFAPGAADVIVIDNEAASNGIISGQVLVAPIAKGRALSGATLTLRRGNVLLDRVLSGSNGAYILRGLPVGSYTLTISKPGFAFALASRTITISVAGAKAGGINFVGTPRP